MKYIGLIVLISGLLLFGCSFTEGNLKLSGKIFDKKTNVPITGRKVFILGFKEADDKIVSSHVAGYFTTDTSGSFAYTLKKIKNIYLYNIYVVGDSVYAFSDNRYGLSELNRDGKFLTFSLSKLTDLTIKINRSAKEPICDTLYLSWSSNGIDGRTLYSYKIETLNSGGAENTGYVVSNKLEWIGGRIQSVVKTKVYADEKTIMRFKLFRNGRYTFMVDTVFCFRDVANNVSFKY